MHLLILNCGSSTVKFKLYSWDDTQSTVLDSGLVEVTENHASAITQILNALPEKPDAVAHRVVHGGREYHKPVLLTPEVIENLKKLSPLAPLHNPPALAGIEATSVLAVPQVAAFDTAFHRNMPPEAQNYALPSETRERFQVYRYGFHGQSYHYLTRKYTQMTGNPQPNLILLHLGAGASAAAIREGQCIDTTMGMTPLEGLVMGSRCGDLDAAIPLYLQKQGLSLEEVEHLLWHESGLMGLANEKDMRTLLERTDEDAKLAVSIFCYRIRKTIGAYLAAIGPVEAIVFTGGIGENAAAIRASILAPLAHLGIRLDKDSNNRNEGKITSAHSTISAYVIPTNEEWMIAQLAYELLQK